MILFVRVTMDIWDFEAPIGTPLKYSTKKGNYCIQNNVQFEFVEDDLLDGGFLNTQVNTQNNFYNGGWSTNNMNNIPRSMNNNNTNNNSFGTHFFNENVVNSTTTFNIDNNNFEQSMISNCDQVFYTQNINKQTYNKNNNNYSYKEKLSMKNYTNNNFAVIPQYFDIPPDSKFFIIKSFTLEHIQRAYTYNIWSSTHLGNKKLSACFKAGTSDSKIFLFFSVNGSGKFCGVAQMISDISKDLDTTIWDNNSKYGSAFKIQWLCVRDIENRMFKHLIVPDNQNKPVTNSRDTQILPKEVGISMLNIFHSKHIKVTSFLDPEQ